MLLQYPEYKWSRIPDTENTLDAQLLLANAKS